MTRIILLALMLMTTTVSVNAADDASVIAAASIYNVFCKPLPAKIMEFINHTRAEMSKEDRDRTETFTGLATVFWLTKSPESRAAWCADFAKDLDLKGLGLE
jgi:hypothetical protein